MTPHPWNSLLERFCTRCDVVRAIGLAAAVHPDDAAIRHQLDDVLARPEFHAEEDFLTRLINAIEEFLRSLRGLGDTSPGLFWLLLVGLIILLMLLVAHIAWTVTKVLRPTSRPNTDEELREQRTRRSIAYRQEAARRAEQGDFTEAIRFLFLSLVYRFDESGRVSFLKAYTNREYLNLFADRPSVYRDLKVFVDTLDDRWYGQRPTDRGLYENCLTLYESLQTP